MQTALIVGFDETPGELTGIRSGQLHLATATDIQRAVLLFGIARPCLVIVKEEVDGQVLGGTVKAICARFPESKIPVVVIGASDGSDNSRIYEWSPAKKGFEQRSLVRSGLRKEIDRLCGLESDEGTSEATPEAISEAKPEAPAEDTVEISESVLKQVRETGNYDSVTRGDRMFHVQTQVMLGETVKIKTTILEGGAVLDSFVKNLEKRGPNLAAQSKKSTDYQHQMAVNKVRMGKYD